MNWQPSGHKHKKQRRQRYRERKAREFIKGLSKKELQELREAIGAHDEGLPVPEIELKRRAGLEIFEEISRRGRGWVYRLRGKKDE